MTLLLDEIDVLETSGDPDAADVRGIEHDSRHVRPGDLFCCLVGQRDDGHAHAAEAVERGAVGLLCERPLSGLPRPVPTARVAEGSGRPAMARAAAAFFGQPSASLLMAGVTGTNGKTTVTHLLGSILEAAGRPTTVIGTLSGARTTPESTELQRMLAEIRDAARRPAGGSGGSAAGTAGGTPDQGGRGDVPVPGLAPAVALEVSSHALVHGRVDAIRFDVAVFTNLSHDHLDFHGTMDAYFAAKAELFRPERAAAGVVNSDDPWGRKLLALAEIPMVAVSSEMVSGAVFGVGRCTFRWRGTDVSMQLTGRVNVTNALLAAEAAVCLGIAPEVVAVGLEAARPVPGRLQPVGAAEPFGFHVIVDYAHTPAALEAALAEARELAGRSRGRAIVVFGCGGERDLLKRPVMGAVAARGADLVVVTSDNPRHEDPAAIIDAVLAGIVSAGHGVSTAYGTDAKAVVEPDRRRAIAAALDAARPGDVVLLAGKGHETTQDLGDRRLPFDDRVVATEILRTMAPGGTRASGEG